MDAALVVHYSAVASVGPIISAVLMAYQHEEFCQKIGHLFTALFCFLFLFLFFLFYYLSFFLSFFFKIVSFSHMLKGY